MSLLPNAYFHGVIETITEKTDVCSRLITCLWLLDARGAVQNHKTNAILYPLSYRSMGDFTVMLFYSSATP